MAEQYRYVFLTKSGHNVLGEHKLIKHPGGQGNEDRYEPRLDDLMVQGWFPMKETVVGDNVLIFLKKTDSSDSQGS